jgi:hypothetical protein
MCPSDTEEVAYHPETRPKESGLSCFMDIARMCGADCMAYLPEVPPGPDYKGQQWAHCKVLADMHRGSKHLTILASAAGDIVRRQGTPPIPVPGGPK